MISCTVPQLSRVLLLWALIIHLAFSVWMYGDPDTLKSDVVQVGNKEWADIYNRYVNGTAAMDKIDLSPKLLRAVVFPNAVLLFTILVFKLVTSFVAAPVLAMLWYDVCFLCTNMKVHRLDASPLVWPLAVVVSGFGFGMRFVFVCVCIYVCGCVCVCVRVCAWLSTRLSLLPGECS
jgi:hypothetical protein